VTVVGDPVRDGLANSYARPGRNVTGLTTLGPKRLELLKDSIPSAARIGTLWNSNTSVTRVAEFEQIQAASQALGVGLISLEVPNPEEFESAFEAARHEGADALLVLADTLTLNRAKQIVALVAQSGLPAMYGLREMAQAGGLMAYAPSLTNNMIRAADYVDRLLRGAKPADLPIEQPREFDFVVNLQTAQALGLTIPEHVLLQATEVIQ
jgi:putative ABC transport system substrate-binding protein